MSTPVNPPENATRPLYSGDANSDSAHLPGGDGNAEGGVDDRTLDVPTSSWSDADVTGRSTTRVSAGHLPPVHATSMPRTPDVEIRDTPTREFPAQPAARQDDVQPERVRAESTLPDQPLPEQNLRAQPMAVGVLPDRETVVAREHERFGGMKFGSAFFGWLTATGLAVLLLAILAAAGVAFGIAKTSTVSQAVSQSQQATGTAKTVGLVGAIVLLVILFVAYYCGGYVAGRMARFDGVKQGLGVWIWAIVTSAIIAVVAAIAGAKYNVLAQLNLPRIPVDEGSVTTVGIIAIAAAILVALLGALLGGAVGTRYHRKVDAVGFDDAIR